MTILNCSVLILMQHIITVYSLNIFIDVIVSRLCPEELNSRVSV